MWAVANRGREGSTFHSQPHFFHFRALFTWTNETVRNCLLRMTTVENGIQNIPCSYFDRYYILSFVFRLSLKFWTIGGGIHKQRKSLIRHLEVQWEKNYNNTIGGILVWKDSKLWVTPFWLLRLIDWWTETIMFMGLKLTARIRVWCGGAYAPRIIYRIGSTSVSWMGLCRHALKILQPNYTVLRQSLLLFGQ